MPALCPCTNICFVCFACECDVLQGGFGVFRNRRARANQVAVAIHIVNAAHGWPKLVGTQVWQGVPVRSTPTSTRIEQLMQCGQTKNTTPYHPHMHTAPDTQLSLCPVMYAHAQDKRTYAANSREYGRSHLSEITVSAVCGAPFNSLRNLSLLPLSTLAISLRI